MTMKPDRDMIEFQQALLRSAQQAVSGQYERIHMPEDIAGRASRSMNVNGDGAAGGEPHCD